jgi:hypothetical protein
MGYFPPYSDSNIGSLVIHRILTDCSLTNWVSLVCMRISESDLPKSFSVREFNPSLINRSISSVSNAHVTTVTCQPTRPQNSSLRTSTCENRHSQLFRIAFPLRQQRNWWSHGESNPDLKLAKLAYCRYTDGPETRCINFSQHYKTARFSSAPRLTSERYDMARLAPQYFFVAVCISNWLQDWELNARASPYESDELPLLYPAITKNSSTICP